jgi:hypothetical protein
LYLKNVCAKYPEDFFEYLFKNVSYSLEILIFGNSVDESFDIILPYLRNPPINLKYIVFITFQKTAKKSRVYFENKIKVPFGCKILHCVYKELTYYDDSNFLIVDEYQES